MTPHRSSVDRVTSLPSEPEASPVQRRQVMVRSVIMASSQHMQRLQVQLTEEQADNLRQTAESEGASQAEIVRRALEAYLRRPIMPREAAVRTRALDTIGAFASGLPDVAEDHDRYLADATLEPSDSTDNA